MYIDINIPNREIAKKLSDVASKTNEEVWVHTLDGLVMVNAKSLLGMIGTEALINHPCHLVVNDSANPDVLFEIVKKVNI